MIQRCSYNCSHFSEKEIANQSKSKENILVNKLCNLNWNYFIKQQKDVDIWVEGKCQRGLIFGK